MSCNRLNALKSIFAKLSSLFGVLFVIPCLALCSAIHLYLVINIFVIILIIIQICLLCLECMSFLGKLDRNIYFYMHWQGTAAGQIRPAKVFIRRVNNSFCPAI